MNWWIKLQQRSPYLKPVEGDGSADGGAPDSGEEPLDHSAAVSDDDFSDLFNDSDDDAEEAAPPTQEEVAPVAEPEPTPEVVEQTPIDDPKPNGETEVEAPPVETPEQQQARVQEWMGALANRYQISEEDAELLISEPEKVLPRLAANIHSAVLVDMAKAVEQMLPAMMQQYLQAQPHVVSQAVETQQTRATARQAFYTTYPDLVGQEAIVRQAATVVEQNFGNLTQEQQVRKVGEISLAMLGKLDALAPAPAPAPVPQPFTPAKTGSQTGSMAQQPANVWSEFLD